MSQWLVRLERAKQGEWQITDLSVFAGSQSCDGDAAALYEVGLWVRAKEVFMKKLVHVSDSVDLIFEYVTKKPKPERVNIIRVTKNTERFVTFLDGVSSPSAHDVR